MLMIVFLGLIGAVVFSIVFASAAVCEVAFGGVGAIERTRIRPQGPDRAGPKCPADRSHKILVTPPEALAIVDLVQRTLPRSEIEGIHDLSLRNSRRAKGLNTAEYAAEKITCPLLSGDGSCQAYAVRPLQCRTWCHVSGENGDRCMLENAGTEDGIVRGLNAAGLDGHVYELNSALAKALSTPDAASRWGRGQEVFAGCDQ